MIVNCSSASDPLTSEEIAMIKAAASRPIVFDEDSPELTAETREAFKRAAAERNKRLTKSASGE